MNNIQALNAALTPEIWKTVSLNLLTKMLSEFMYEEIIKPDVIDDKEDIVTYQLNLPDGLGYRFTAKLRVFDSYRVDPKSIYRGENDEWTPATNPFQFALDIHEIVGMTGETTAHLLKELTNTLIADAHIYQRKQSKNVDLLNLNYAELEGEMEGHPWITFNKGRIGFGYDDYLEHAPESKQSIQMTWLAIAREQSSYNGVTDLEYERLIEEELSPEAVARFSGLLEERGLEPAKYYFMPVHDWQWKNIVVPIFGEAVALQSIVYLGKSEDLYLPQQSIRTFVNTSHSQKRHVKLPLSILNTLVYRGLPNERTQIAPKVTEYIKSIHANDPFLSEECRMILPGEVASLNYNHNYYKQLSSAPYQYKEMLGCLWRESVLSYTDPDERPVTLASLVHLDADGYPLILKLVDVSGLTLEDWLDRLFNTVLPPLLHYLYQYGTVFSPHGENTILVLKNNIPSRLAMKDFVDDVNISDQPLPELLNLSADLKEVLLTEPPEGLCQFIFAGLFICHHRYLSDLLDQHICYPEVKFWRQVRQAILNYQEKFPQLQDRFELFNLLAPKFTKLCLNRNRLITYGYNDDSDRPHAAAYGKVNNALHTVLHDADYDQLIARKKKFQAALTTPFDYYDAQYNKTASIRTVDYGQDLERIFNWMHQRHLVPFWKLNLSFTEFQKFLRKSLTAIQKDLVITSLEGEPICYGIFYQVAADNIRHFYPYQKSDIGGHIAIGERRHLTPEYLIPIFRASFQFAFKTYDTERIIIEPDAKNRILIPLLTNMGFKIYDTVKLPHKKATLMILEKHTFFSEFSKIQTSHNFVRH
ncbi:GNAT family N-acetyltransferase (plasmid) [Picosynechococcus sp. PCC 11901]|uniref:GNAT family N-acetyltransferase n=1 Tax=Picosynechococcus sp. PCC 11901 TaxID=2579791 RepID=UPI0010FBE2A6|nr:GNAT family N-acetyltransferase [Picosynechococcus sp. PCC 11901]QCS51053.1 GNAT family N-acetyltransferase [Picosynechococcus sp. PCC 11901]